MPPMSSTIAIHERSRPRLASKALLRFDRHEQRFLLLYPERGMMLSGTAAEILRLCNGLMTIETMVNVLSERYPGNAPEVILNDVLAFMSELRSRGLIEV